MNHEKTKSFKRATAIKLHINHLTSGNYVKDDMNNYLTTKIGINVSRVRILGTIVGKWMPTIKNDEEQEKIPQATIILDDGTETIRVKVWKDDVKKFEEVEIGDIVDIIGHVREYEDEIYINPEIIKKLEDPNWELVRELEIIEFIERINSANKFQRKSTEIPKRFDKNLSSLPRDKTEKGLIKEKIVQSIKNLDQGQGVNSNQLKEYLNIPELDFEEAIKELINEGTIYKPGSGRYKIL